ncbi:MAG: helix-turn-helix domain-containing protein [Planctomycetota bacterium]
MELQDAPLATADDREQARQHWRSLVHVAIEDTNLRLKAVADKIGARISELRHFSEEPDIDSLALIRPLSELCGLRNHQLVNAAIDVICGRSSTLQIQSLDRLLVRAMAISGMPVGQVCSTLGLRRNQLLQQILHGTVPQESERRQQLQRFLELDDETFADCLRYTEARTFARTAELSEDSRSLRDLIIARAAVCEQRPIEWGARHGLTGGVISNILVRAKVPRRKSVIARLKEALGLDDDTYRIAVRMLILEGVIRSNKKNVLQLPVLTALQQVIREEMDQNRWRQRQLAQEVGISESTINRILKQADFVPREIVRLKLQRYLGINAVEFNTLMSTRVGEGVLDADIKRLLERCTVDDKRALIHWLQERLDAQSA